MWYYFVNNKGKFCKCLILDIFMTFLWLINILFLLIEYFILNLSRIYFCILEIFQTNVSNRFLSTKSPFEINCVLVLWIHKGYCVVKKLVWKIRIKAFCIKKYWISYYLRKNILQGFLGKTGQYFPKLCLNSKISCISTSVKKK